MGTISGGDLFLKILVDEGVTHLFGNPGTTELPVMDALSYHQDLSYILGLQEAVVVAMADGYARASGRLAACNVHVAPGLGNAMGSIFNANFSRSPIIVTAGQQEQGHGLMEPLLFGDLVAMARPNVKWATEVTRAEDLPRVLRRAAKVALTPPTGPVFISLPGDVLNKQINVDLGKPTRVETGTLPSQETISIIGRRLLNAKSPLLVCGQGMVSGNALREAARLAELIGAKAMQQSFPTGAHYLSEHPTFCGGIGRVQNQVRDVLANHDLIIALGGDVFRMSVFAPVEAVPIGTQIIQISQEDWELGKNFPVDIAIRADIKLTLDELSNYIELSRTTDQIQRSRERLDRIARNNWSQKRNELRKSILTKKEGEAVDPERLMLEISESLPKNAIVVEEALLSSRQLPNLLAYRERHDFFALDSGGIGFAIAGAVGISLAQPTRPIIAIIGDGSALYGFQALWTAANQNLPITYIICNNSSYRILKERLLAFHGNDNFIGMDMRNPPINFHQMAQSFGIWSKRTESIADFSTAFREACKRSGPKLIDVKVTDGF